MRRIALLGGCLLALATPALAAEGGLYFGLFGGGVAVQGVENESDTGTFNFEFDPGWLGGATFGYDLRDAFPSVGTGRVELEAAWRENDFDKIEFSDGDQEATGKAKVASVMLNTIGEYLDSRPWIPYIGAGAGAARITLDKVIGTDTIVDDEDTVFAYQGLAGIGLQAGRVYFDLGYRYFALLNPEFTDANGIDFDSEYASHNITLGARFDF